jgi:hypothetical protein
MSTIDQYPFVGRALASDDLLAGWGQGAQVKFSAAQILEFVGKDSNLAAGRAEAAALIATAASATAPGVYITRAAGIAAVNLGQTFWYEGRAGVLMLARKTDALTATNITAIGSPDGRGLSAYGAIPDAKIVELAAMTAGSPILDSSVAVFDASDVGKSVAVAGAGGGATKLRATIIGYVSPNSVTLDAPATATTTTRGATLGTDCGAALATAFAAAKANGGGTIVIDGLYFLASPVLADMANAVSQLQMVGYGGDTGLLIAQDLGVDAITIKNAPRLRIDGVNFAGTPLDPDDARRVFSLQNCGVRIRDCGFYGLATITQAEGAIVWTVGCEVATSDNVFGGCVGSNGNASPVLSADDWIGFTSERDRFIDYGTFRGILYIKTGIAFTYAWIRIREQFTDQANAVGQGVVRVIDTRFDEGHVIALAIGTAAGSGRRIGRVHLSGIQANNSLVDGASAIAISRADEVTIERCAIGYANTPHDSIVVEDCGNVLIDQVKVSDGAAAGRTGKADGLRATMVTSLTLKDSPDYTRLTLVSVGSLRQIHGGRGGVTPFTKSGRITDLDFSAPPPVGTIGLDLANNRLYARSASGWIATPVLQASTNDTFVLSNVTPATGTVAGRRYTKTSGGNAWGNSTANLAQTFTVGFDLIASFPATDPGTYAKVGVIPTSVGADYVVGQNDLLLSIYQSDGAQIYLQHNSDLIAGPFPYIAGQPVELAYSRGSATLTMKVNGATVVDALAAPSDIGAIAEMRFSSTVYTQGAAFDLLQFDPLVA